MKCHDTSPRCPVAGPRSEEDAELRRRQQLSDLDLQIQRTQQATTENLELLTSHQELLEEVRGRGRRAS